MSPEQLESFVTIARVGKLGRAAVELHITEPPLSRRIRALEEELGTPLFTRHARGMRLTAAGQRLLPHAVDILDRVRAFSRGLGELSSRDT